MILEWAGQAAAIAGTLLLVLFLVALGGIAYKHLRGDGIEWPDDRVGKRDVGEGDVGEGDVGVDDEPDGKDGADDEPDGKDGADDEPTLRRGSEDDEWTYY
ncbi:hypothetical protein [Halopenitus sp. POP-27]|uniref:hypothetical protein n=1 Tax=Halopenitus sp. POP-27 TaxID=2994425 RepID=UPI002469AA4F|nr:hypothetical protein [Halopenitus sp. POP-27]